MSAEAEEVQEKVKNPIEDKARADGWAPLDEWKGDPEKWKSAEQFVEDGEHIASILKSKVERLEGKLDSALETNKKFNEFTQRALEKERKEKESAIRELEEARKQAVTDGDGEAFARADKQIDELKTQPQQEQQLDPQAKAWLNDNNWYQQNEKLTVYADGLADMLAAQGYTGKAYFDELSKRVRDTFPEDFGNKNRKKPNTVESGGEAVVDTGSRTFDKLPKEAKDAYKQFAKDIPGFTKEQFVSQYDWD